MQHFTISDIESLCGIKAHTLRIWEQRYSFFSPKRKKSQHRFYDNEDLKKLLRIAFLYHNGWKVSKIAALTDNQILQEVRKEVIGPGNNSTFILQLLEAALDFNERAFTALMEKLTDKLGFESCITDVCYPYLERIGLLWLTSNVIPAQEHFSSYLIQHRIIAETDKLSVVPTGSKTVLLFTPRGEHHELPLLFLHYLFKKNGWATLYMGSNVEAEQLKQVVDNKEVHCLFLHLITNFTGTGADDYLESICRTFPRQTVAASGKSVFDVQRNFANLVLLKSDKAIMDFIQRNTE